MIVIFLINTLISTSAFSQAGLSLSGEEVRLDFPQSHDFFISASSATLSIGDCLSYTQSENVLLNVSKTIGEKALEVDKFISFDGVKQWKLVHFEDFAQPSGWTDNSNSQCSGVVMLGGYCLFSSQEVMKTFNGLPSHSAVKIVGNFHFIDAWIGETGYLKVKVQGQQQYVWTEGYKAGQAGDGKNLCGAHHAEGKFFAGIEIVVPHSDDSLEITFGATLEEDPCDESWGVSALQIFTR
jgi:hypothetical protein